MSIVERYHEPLCRAFNILKTECRSFTFVEALLEAVKSINDCTGLEGLVTTLLVFGAMPRLGTAHDHPHPDIVHRAAAVAKTTKLMSTYFVKRQVSDAKMTRNGPDSTKIRGTPIDSYVMVYRERGTTGTSEWTGPFVSLAVTDSSDTVLGQAGPQTFRLSHVKRYFEPSPIQTNSENTHTLHKPEIRNTFSSSPQSTTATGSLQIPDAQASTPSPHYPSPISPVTQQPV